MTNPFAGMSDEELQQISDKASKRKAQILSLYPHLEGTSIFGPEPPTPRNHEHGDKTLDPLFSKQEEVESAWLGHVASAHEENGFKASMCKNIHRRPCSYILLLTLQMLLDEGIIEVVTVLQGDQAGYSLARAQSSVLDDDFDSHFGRTFYGWPGFKVVVGKVPDFNKRMWEMVRIKDADKQNLNSKPEKADQEVIRFLNEAGFNASFIQECICKFPASNFELSSRGNTYLYVEKLREKYWAYA
jgi:hypothetical protein